MLSNKEEKFIAKASQYAQQSTMYNRHSCVVVLNGVEIANGYNSKRNYSRDGFIDQCYSCHAEVCALRNAVKKTKADADERKQKSFMRRVCLYVVRINPQNQYLDSKPCQQCYHKLQTLGVRHVVYSNGIAFTKTDLRKPEPHQDSSGYTFIKRLK